MTERPILFSGEMVRAILEGRKTMTRRVIKPETLERFINLLWNPNENISLCPYGQPGDRLWVRETWGVGTRPDPNDGWRDGIEYRADQTYLDEIEELPLYSVAPAHDLDLAKYESEGWRPSIHMPRWASRILLEVVSVRVERVQDIAKGTQAEVIHRIEAEGVTCESYTGAPYCTNCSGHEAPCHIEKFQRLWDSIAAKRGYGWDANPWIWVIEFKRMEAQE